MLAVLALTVVSGALSVALPEPIAHVGGSLFRDRLRHARHRALGIVHREFLVPVGAVLQGRATMRELARLWTVTMVGNVMGLLVLSLILTRADLVPPETLKAAGTLADTIAERHLLGAALSAVVAGLVITLSTWAPTPSRPTSPGSLSRC